MPSHRTIHLSGNVPYSGCYVITSNNYRHKLKLSEWSIVNTVNQSRVGSVYTAISRVYPLIFKFLQEDHIVQLVNTAYHSDDL
jgi:hypothetical protein